MNLGQGAAVVMYELGKAKRFNTEDTEKSQRARRRRGKSEKEFAEMETVERIGEALLEALRKSGYIAARGEATAEEKLRRLLRRFSMEAADAEVLLGMVRKILWKLEQK